MAARFPIVVLLTLGISAHGVFVARRSDTIAYEVVCAVGQRVRRTYVGGAEIELPGQAQSPAAPGRYPQRPPALPPPGPAPAIRTAPTPSSIPSGAGNTTGCEYPTEIESPRPVA